MSSPGITETLEHYLGVVLRTQEDRSRAIQLALADVHAAVQRALAELGPLTVATDGDIADISCVYAVGDPEREHAVVFLSSVLPYAAVIAWHGSRPGGFVTDGELGWAGTVVSCLTERGFFVLDEEACRTKRPVAQWPDGPVFSYFGALLQDEFGPPEDYWLWLFSEDAPAS